MRVLFAILAAIRFAVAAVRHPGRPVPPIPEVMTEEEVKRALAAAASAPDVSDATDWQRSIVDLLKILRMDSSAGARAMLAKELGYSGNAPIGSAEMNIWLHKVVMQKVAEHCYEVPGHQD